MELPDAVAETMAAAGTVELVKEAAPKPAPEPKVETRPAPADAVEKRAPARKPAARKRTTAKK